MNEREPHKNRKERREETRRANKKTLNSRHAMTRRSFLFGSGVSIAVATAGYWVLNTQRGIDLPTSPADIRSRLNELNPRALTNMRFFRETAPEISAMAVTFFCNEMNSIMGTDSYHPSRMTGKINHYDQRVDYERALQQTASCVYTERSEDTEGAVNIYGSETVYVNLPNLIAPPNPISLRDRITTPAAQLFGAVIHELHHVWPPQLPISPAIPRSDRRLQKTIALTSKRGLVQVGFVPELALPGKQCVITSRQQPEEALVQQSTNKMTEKVGFIIQTSPDYIQLVRRYENEIINKLFSRDHHPLLRFHQRTQDKDLLSKIGEYFTNDLSKLEDTGDQVLYQVLVQGKRIEDISIP